MGVGEVTWHSLTEDGKVEIVNIKFGNSVYENVSVKHLKPINLVEHQHEKTDRDDKNKKVKEKMKKEDLDPYKDFGSDQYKPEYNLNLGSFVDHYQKFIKFMKKHKEVPDKNKREWALAIRKKVGQGMFNGHMNQMRNIMDLLQMGEKFRNLKERKIAEQKLNLFLEKNTPTNPSKWSYYKSQAKKKFDVYPSAYANAWAAKQYKAAGGGWKKG